MKNIELDEDRQRTIEQVATWMEQRVRDTGRLTQSEVVKAMRNGAPEAASMLYKNVNGNLAIDKEILRRFRDLTGDSVVWANQSQSWRLRRPEDPPGRRQVRY